MPSHVPNLLDPYKYSSREQRVEYAAGLRELADWVETTEFPLHRWAIGDNEFDQPEVGMHSTTFEEEDQDFVKRVGSAARLIGGRVDKGEAWAGGDFHLTRTFRGGVRFRFSIDRKSVCTQVEIVKEVAKPMPVDFALAAQLEREKKEIEERLADLTTEIKTVTEVVKEYRCPPSLLAAERTMA